MLDASRTASLNGTFRVLTSAYRGVPRIFEKHRLERFVDPLVKDVYVWLRTDEEFLEPQDTILYPISRARALFDTTSTTPSRTQ